MISPINNNIGKVMMEEFLEKYDYRNNGKIAETLTSYKPSTNLKEHSKLVFDDYLEKNFNITREELKEMLMEHYPEKLI
jgi:ribosomal protein S12 methylthiotransferase accessory factor YcaO